MKASRRDRSITLLLALAQAALMFSLAWSRYAACHNETFDLALYARTAWGLARGDVWNPIADTTFIHLHAAWILIPLGLIGRAVGTVTTLLLAQSLAIAACIWPLTRIATRHLGRVGMWVAPLLWIAYPNLGHVGSYEFHPGTLALLPLCWALDALDRRDTAALTWSCAAVLFCRADYALLTIVMGVLLATSGEAEHRRPGKRIAVASLSYLLLVLIAQHFNPTHGITSAQLHFGVWGGSPLGILTTLFTDPVRVWSHVTAVDRLSYLPRVLLPLACLPLLSARWLWIAAPIIAINLISTWPTAARLDSHYLTPAVPVLVVSAIAGAARLPALWRTLRWTWLTLPIAASVWLGGLPWSRDFAAAEFRADARTAACIAIVARIPIDASTQAPDALLPHLAERDEVLRGPPPERHADFVVLDTTHRKRFSQNEDLLRTQEEPLTRAWLARSDHEVIDATDMFVLLRHGHDPRAGWAKRYFRKTHANFMANERGTRLTECLVVEQATRIGANLRLELRAEQACPPDLAIRIGTDAKPRRVDLLFDGLLSPAQLRPGDRLISTHSLTRTEAAAIGKSGLWVGALRSSGARPQPKDPIARRIPLDIAP
jgi:uncharacterized membrane protein